jgi:integral membrane protein (TIGR01906 family)
VNIVSRIGRFFLRLLISFGYVLLVISVGVRLVMTPLFLFLEYHRIGFPSDFYGFSVSDRLFYSSQVLTYLLENRSDDYLTSLSFDVGSSLFNDREIVHMIDVNSLSTIFFGIILVILILLIISIIRSYFSLTIRIFIRESIQLGSYITIGLILFVVTSAIVSWETFFSGFHKLFFTENTWIFEYSDSLIRLFPEQFWFDAAILVGGIAVLLALFTQWIILRLPYWSSKPQ